MLIYNLLLLIIFKILETLVSYFSQYFPILFEVVTVLPTIMEFIVRLDQMTAPVAAIKNFVVMELA